MRIRSLRLDRYGAFEDRQVEFGPGLTVVAGANEAGKSTLLDALSDLLWGFQRGRRAFFYGPGALALTATVELPGEPAAALADGAARTDGPAAGLPAEPVGLVGPAVGPAEPVGLVGLVGPAEPVGPWTAVELRRRGAGLQLVSTGQPAAPVWGAGGAEAHQRWLQAFGLSHRQLRQGGEALFNGGGDLAELVFTARSGQAVRGLLDALHTEMDVHYKQHGNDRSSRVRVALREHQELAARIQEAMTTAGAVVEARAERDRQAQAVRAAHKLLMSAAERTDSLDRRRRAAPAVRDLAAARDEIARLRADGAAVLDVAGIA
uniref:AAA family ATPase n=1 Tax=Frankia sp. CiP1_Cm_nod2 TaxID=2897161 RepID=UPI0040447905